MSRFQRVTIALCGVVLLMDGFDAQSMGFLVPPISESLGIPLSSFGPVLAAALVGLMIGAMLSGPIADRWGRRWVLILSTLVFGVFSLGTTLSTSVGGFVIFRFLTGLGLGGALPNVVALASEYAPARLQPVLVTSIFAGLPAGALVASVIASVALPIWGWKSVFFAGGVLPIVIAIALFRHLPESVRFLTVRGADAATIRGILVRISPELAGVPLELSGGRTNRTAGLPVTRLFADGRALGTILLWIPFFLNLLVLYFMVSWLPALLRQSGMPVSVGVAAVSMFSIGGIVGSLGHGGLIRRLGGQRTIFIDFCASFVLIVVQASMFASIPALMVLTFLLGVCVQGAQAGLNVLAAVFYPTAIRSTGVGWALSIGRIGSIIGPTLGGAMLALQWTPQEIFRAGAVPAACAAITMGLTAVLAGPSNPFTNPSQELSIDSAAE